MLSTRYMDTFELRQALEMKNTEVATLRKKVGYLQKRVETITEWNIKWQKCKWDEELVRQCGGLEKEFSVLSDVESAILSYLSQKHVKQRHVRGIAKETGINPATTSRTLKKLARKRLIRAYLRNSYRKKYYTLSVAREFIQKNKNCKNVSLV